MDTTLDGHQAGARAPTLEGLGATEPGAGLNDLEAVIERGLTTFLEVGQALREIRDRRLYHVQGYSAFEAYCRERWGWSKRHANRTIESAETAEILGPIGPSPRTESVARELAPLARQDPDQAKAVWSEVVRDAGERGVKLTALEAQRAVDGVVKRKEKEEKKRRRETERERAVEDMASVELDECIRLVHADFQEALAGDEVPGGSVDLERVMNFNREVQ